MELLIATYRNREMFSTAAAAVAAAAAGADAEFAVVAGGCIQISKLFSPEDLLQKMGKNKLIETAQ